MTSKPGIPLTEPQTLRVALQQAMAENGFAYQQADGSYDLPLRDMDGVIVGLSARGFRIEREARGIPQDQATPFQRGYDLGLHHGLSRSARGIPLIDVELLARAAAVHGIAVRDREGGWNLDSEWAEKVVAEYERLSHE